LAYADAPEDADDGGAAASDPTAAVNFQDLKLRYFNLPEPTRTNTANSAELAIAIAHHAMAGWP
jgi:hypothetical protein